MTPAVSVIVPTRNSQATLENCLRSIKEQTYRNHELIVMDNHSTDATQDIARRYTQSMYVQGPERSAQRNVGAQKARGEYVLFVDSDMVLSARVVAECVAAAQRDPSGPAVVIPELSFGTGFWARCKRLEKQLYLGVTWMEAARFYHRQQFVRSGGFNTTLSSGEDWDLSQRYGQQHGITRIEAPLYHNEGRLRLLTTLGKKFHYAGTINHYFVVNRQATAARKQRSLLRRYGLFLSRPRLLLANPLTSLGLFGLKFGEFMAGALALVLQRTAKNKA